MKFQKLININIFNESLIHCISQLKDHTFYTLLLIADEKCIFEQVCMCVCVRRRVFEISAKFPITTKTIAYSPQSFLNGL